MCLPKEAGAVMRSYSVDRAEERGMPGNGMLCPAMFVLGKMWERQCGGGAEQVSGKTGCRHPNLF